MLIIIFLSTNAYYFEKEKINVIRKINVMRIIIKKNIKIMIQDKRQNKASKVTRLFLKKKQTLHRSLSIVTQKPPLLIWNPSSGLPLRWCRRRISSPLLLFSLLFSSSVNPSRYACLSEPARALVKTRFARRWRSPTFVGETVRLSVRPEKRWVGV